MGIGERPSQGSSVRSRSCVIPVREVLPVDPPSDIQCRNELNGRSPAAALRRQLIGAKDAPASAIASSPQTLGLSGPAQAPLLVDLSDARAVPDVAKVLGLAAVRQQPGPEHRGAFATSVPDAVVGDGVGT